MTIPYPAPQNSSLVRALAQVPKLAPALVAAPLLIGCPNNSLTVAETDVVVTIEAKDQDYSKLKTFFVPDEVVDLCDASLDGPAGLGGSFELDCEPGNHSLDRTILRELRERMVELGYTEIDDPETEAPDVAFFVGTVAQDNWYLATAPGYCYGYDYYWWYWSCWVPSYSYAYNLPTATVLIDMAVIDEENKGATSVWTAFFRGLAVKSSEKTGEQRIQDAMERAFDQSPYLAEGGK